MTGFDAFLWEFIGTALLLLLGNGVCALVNLRTSGARGSDWVVIALGSVSYTHLTLPTTPYV